MHESLLFWKVSGLQAEVLSLEQSQGVVFIIRQERGLWSSCVSPSLQALDKCPYQTKTDKRSKTCGDRQRVI